MMVRGLVIAVVLAVFALFAGVIAAGVLCGDGGCAAARGIADALGGDGAPFTISGTPMEIGAALLTFGLIVTLLPREPVIPLTVIFAVLLLADGFLMALKPPSSVSRPEVAQIEEEPAVIPDPSTALPRTTPAPQRAASQESTDRCPSGQFRDDGACVPCEIEQQTAADPALQFVPVNTRAHWVYASDRLVSRRGAKVSPVDLMRELARDRALCDAPGLLVFGSASSDGERDRNKRRAARRAQALAKAASSVCGESVQTFALSLGQSRARQDVEEDRPVSIIKVYPLTDAEITGETILRELGYELAEGDAAVPLLSRRDRFPEPWTDDEGGRADLSLEPRPQVTEIVEAFGAPASCRGESNGAAPANIFETDLPDLSDWQEPEAPAERADTAAPEPMPVGLDPVDEAELTPVDTAPEMTEPQPALGPGRRGVDDPLFLRDTPLSRR